MKPNAHPDHQEQPDQLVSRDLTPQEWEQVNALTYNQDGLIPAIVQDVLDGTVLMMAWMNQESVIKTLTTGRTWFWSRSRQELWPKGATSGHWQIVKDVRYDCDRDTLLITVEQVGDVACHTGARSCFFGQFGGDESDPTSESTSSSDNSPSKVPPLADTLTQVFRIVKHRQADPQPQSYTSQLLTKGENSILKKLGEETAEVVMACKDRDPEAIANELADLWYHGLVALAYYQVDVKDVYRKLQTRRSAKPK